MSCQARVACVAAVLCVPPPDAFAHGLTVFLATPLTPPQGDALLPPVFLTACALGLALALSRWGPRAPSPLWRELPRAVLAVAAFVLGVTFCGLFARVSRATLGDLLDPQYRPLLGFGLSSPVGVRFLAWNTCVAAFLATLTAALCHRTLTFRHHAQLIILGLAVPFVALFGGPPLLLPIAFLAVGSVWSTHAVRCTACVLVLYLLALTPLVVLGHIAHGTAGPYTADECSSRLDSLGAAALGYAKAHRGVLPAGASTEDVLPALGPYLRRPQVASTAPAPWACPIGFYFLGDERPLRWNPALSGSSVETLLRITSPPDLFSCPHAAHLEHYQSPRQSTAQLARDLDRLLAVRSPRYQPDSSWTGAPEVRPAEHTSPTTR